MQCVNELAIKAPFGLDFPPVFFLMLSYANSLLKLPLRHVEPQRGVQATFRWENNVY